MATSAVLNGVTYPIPQEGDTSWGTDLSAYLVALATAFPQASGGTFSGNLTCGANLTVTGVLAVNGTSSGKPFAEYNTAAGQSISHNTVTIVNYGTLVTDTDNAVTTGASWKFTVPAGKGGQYLVEFNTMWSATGTTASSQFYAGIYKNGSEVKDCYNVLVTPPSSGGLIMAGSCVVNCSAGDYLDVRILQSTGGGSRTLTATAAKNRISVKGLV